MTHISDIVIIIRMLAFWIWTKQQQCITTTDLLEHVAVTCIQYPALWNHVYIQIQNDSASRLQRIKLSNAYSASLQY